MNYKTQEKNYGKEYFLEGNFTFRDHDTFFEIIGDMKKCEYSTMIFNFDECDFVDSAALGMLVIAHDEANIRKIKLVIKNAHDEVLKYLLMARFDTLYEFNDYASLDDCKKEPVKIKKTRRKK